MENIFEKYNDKTVIVTGGTGMIGRAVVDLLLENTTTKILVLSLDNFDPWKSLRVSFAPVDLCDYKKVLDYTEGSDYVFHIAGIKGSIDVTIKKPASFFVPLLMMNTNVLEACRINKVKKVLYTSSIGAYPSNEIFYESNGYNGTPMDFYPGWAKRMAEFQIASYRKQYDLKNYAIVRLSNVYGPGDNFDPDNAMVIPSLIYKAINGPYLVKIWGDGSSIRDFAYSKDIAMGIIQAMHYDFSSFDFLNLGGGVEYSVKELVETLNDIIPFGYEWGDSKDNGFPRRVMSIDMAKNLIDYNPKYSLKEGLKETINWYLENKKEFLKRKNYFNE